MNMTERVIVTLKHPEVGAARDLEIPTQVRVSVLGPIIVEALGWPKPQAAENIAVEYSFRAADGSFEVKTNQTLASVGVLTGDMLNLETRLTKKKIPRPKPRRLAHEVTGPALISAQGQAFELKCKEVWVGRADLRQGINPGIDLTDLADGDTVSRRHARLRLRKGGFYIQDMSSNYGTWVNEQAITGQVPTPLQPGDRVRFGEVRLTFQAAPSFNPAREKPAPGSIRVRIMHGELFEMAAVSLNLKDSVRDAIVAILQDSHWPATTSSGRPLAYRLYRQTAPGQRLPDETLLKELAFVEGEVWILEREESESGEALGQKESSRPEAVTEIADSAFAVLAAEDGRRFMLGRGMLNMGRADTTRGIPDIDLTTYDRDNSVSRQHAQIVCQDNVYYVRDLNSINGVRVNGQSLQPETLHRLTANDKAQFGDVVLTFQEIKQAG